MTTPLDLVAQQLATSAAGRATALHVHGPRGAGKTWVLEQAAAFGAERDMTVLTSRGMAEDREIPFAALAMLLAPVRDRVRGDDWAALAPVLRFDHRGTDPFEVKLACFQFLCALAAERPTVLLLDDVHLFDAASLDVLAFAVRRADADALCCISTAVDPSPLAPGGAVVRVEPLDAGDITRLLEARGVAPAVASQCASACLGNPGLALAISDGLNDEQRIGAAPIAVLPRPAGGLADELQRRLREHGDAVCRALVVAAAEHSGEVAAVRSALGALGEGTDGLRDAEAAGLLEIVGTRVVFADPWTRAAAYHLVAPASRRAAHRALAAWFTEPNQAADRAWHLAAGADGPNAAVADALGLLATDTAHRGAPGSAALTAERAAEFAEDAPARQARLQDALGWWLDAANVEGVTRVLRQLAPVDDEGRAAVAEAQQFLHGTEASAVEPTAGTWGRRRARRMQLADAASTGDHRTILRLVDRRAIEHGRGEDLLALAIAHRHAGRVREAREHLVRAQAVLDPRCAPGVEAALLEADLDVLQGRHDDALVALAALDHATVAHVDDHRHWLRARAALVSDPTARPADAPAALAAPGGGALGEVRVLVRDGALRHDASVLDAAARLADEHTLPIESAEARLWQATLLADDARRSLLQLVQGAFHRCGVRGWDARVAALASEQRLPVATVRDPAIDALSQAELRVADAVARGLTNREVAATLLISVKTVDFHLQQIYRKIGVRSRTELAVRMAGQAAAATGERR